jgi:hypothetical protein
MSIFSSLPSITDPVCTLISLRLIKVFCKVEALEGGDTHCLLVRGTLAVDMAWILVNNSSGRIQGERQRN